MNHWALWEDVETQFLHLVENVLEGDGCSEGSGQSYQFRLSAAQSDLPLHGALPQEWNSGVGDDVAMSGPGCVNVLACKLGVPSSSKVGIHMDLQALGWVRGQDDALVPGAKEVPAQPLHCCPMFNLWGGAEAC